MTKGLSLTIGQFCGGYNEIANHCWNESTTGNCCCYSFDITHIFGCIWNTVFDHTGLCMAVSDRKMYRSISSSTRTSWLSLNIISQYICTMCIDWMACNGIHCHCQMMWPTNAWRYFLSITISGAKDLFVQKKIRRRRETSKTIAIILSFVPRHPKTWLNAIVCILRYSTESKKKDAQLIEKRKYSEEEGNERKINELNATNDGIWEEKRKRKHIKNCVQMCEC